MPEWLLEMGKQAPMLALSLGFIWIMHRFILSENVRRDKVEARHAEERKEQTNTFLKSISTVSGECHASQDRASESLVKIADATRKTGDTMIRIDTNLETLITLAKP